MNTLITAAQLQQQLQGAGPVVVLDCSFDLADTSAGERAFAQAHVAGARYAHLDRDWSGPKLGTTTGDAGRHPLPDRQALAHTLGRLGITPRTQVVVYDNQGMPYAARAWWLLRWMGHTQVAVLDGGLTAWQAAGGLTVEGDGTTSPTAATPPYPALAAAMPTVDAAAVLHNLQSAAPLVQVLDARAAERFRGEVEPLDPVAGHIPGAKQRFFKDNLQASGCFKPAAQLRAEFEALGLPAAHAVVHQCGSGVTACHNLLAMAHAGLGDGLLYPGSWSGWCSDASRPVARGA
jgi:thiosulfate/3-mercaptopyruvate sulfurtransferase